MRLVVFGDIASGKSTIVNKLSNELGIPGVTEDARFCTNVSSIPLEIEADKFQSNLWFSHYYHQRDLAWRDQPVILEYCLQAQHPFTEAQYRAGKINEAQRTQCHELINQLSIDVPLSSYDLALYLLTPFGVTRTRLEARGLCPGVTQEEYWRFRREEGIEYFSSLPFKLINTDQSTPDQVLQTIISALA